MKRTGQFEIFKRRAFVRGVGVSSGLPQRRARSEIWFGRFRAANGKIQWRTSEGYSRRRGVVKAIKALDVFNAMAELELHRGEGDIWILK